MMSELWLWRQCDFILVFMFRQLETGIAKCIALRQGFKNMLSEDLCFLFGSPMCSGNN